LREIQPAQGIQRPGGESKGVAGNKYTPRGTKTWGGDSKLFYGEQLYALADMENAEKRFHVPATPSEVLSASDDVAET